MEQDSLGTQMILPDFILPGRINQRWKYSGLDSPNQCVDKQHFADYPFSVEYNYNSRGFRDQEWPNSVEELKNAIWCVGDSFTVGLGSPIEHTWPWLLQKQTGRRVINVSLDGAGNNWSARRTALIQKEINPTNIVVMWSYIHRRENENENISDEQRRLQSISSTHVEDACNFAQCIDMLANSHTTQLVIPGYSPDYNSLWNNVRGENWPTLAPNTVNKMGLLPEFVQTELKEYFKVWTELQELIELQTVLGSLEHNFVKVPQLDLARDGHHFGIVTAQWVVDQIVDDLIL
jgi:hypothetical protein